MSEADAPLGSAAERWDVLAREAARRRESQGEALDLQQLLSFRVGRAAYALPVDRVREIVRLRPFTPVPCVPEDVLGVISLRGEITQVVDLGLRLGLAAADSTRASRIIVVQAGDGQIAGLLVDAVLEVLSVGEGDLRPASSETGAVASLCLREQEFVSLLDLDRVLDVDAEQ